MSGNDEWSVREVANRYPDLTGVEFDTPVGVVRGWAREDGRINAVPYGWHAYSVTDTDAAGFDPVAIVDHGVFVNHRFDFITRTDLDGLVMMDRLDGLDEWGFTRQPITEAADNEEDAR